MKLALAAPFFCGCILEMSTLLTSRPSSDIDKKHSKQFQELLRRTFWQLIPK